MKQSLLKTKLALAIVAAMGIAACNDAGDNATTSPINSAPISKTTSGVITGFGSVFINGVEYETDGTTFVVDGEEGDESLLKLGMVITLTGTDDNDGTGNAVKVEFEDEVEGIVIANNYAVDGTLNVMGLTIHTSDDTVFESNEVDILDLSMVAAGNVVEVSGYSSDDSSVLATRIEVKKAAHVDGDEIEVKGIISGLTDTTFYIGDMMIDYTTAVLDDDLSMGLENGMLVDVESESGFDNSILLASEIELKSLTGKREHVYDDDDEKVEVEGLITSVTSATEIAVNGAPVILDANTFFIHGDAATALVGLKVKVVGMVNAEGNLVAEKVVYKPTGDIKLTGQITALDIASNSVQMFGRTITLDNYTMVKDNKNYNGQGPVKYNFGVDDLVVGDWLKIKAYENADGGLTAIKLMRKNYNDDHEVKLEGYVDAIDPLTYQLTLSGITIDYSTLPNFSAQVGDKVEVKGELLNGVFTLTELELEDDEDEYYVGGKDGYEDDERDDDSRSDDDDEHSDEDESDDDDDDDEDDDVEDSDDDDSSSTESSSDDIV